MIIFIKNSRIVKTALAAFDYWETLLNSTIKKATI